MDLAPAPSVGVPWPWRWLEQRIDRAFGASLNPLRHLGALAFLALWLLALSGVWLYAGFDTSVSGSYASIERLSSAPWSPGGLMRSLHRYATDAFVVLTALHLLREALAGRWRHFRRFSWLTGCAVLPLVATTGRRNASQRSTCKGEAGRQRPIRRSPGAISGASGESSSHGTSTIGAAGLASRSRSIAERLARFPAMVRSRTITARGLLSRCLRSRRRATAEDRVASTQSWNPPFACTATIFPSVRAAAASSSASSRSAR